MRALLIALLLSSGCIEDDVTTLRETILAPLGLVSTPNPYGVFPEGSLAQAENVLTRAQGMLITAPSVVNSITLPNVNDVIWTLMPLDSGHVYTWQAAFGVWTITESGNAVTIPAAFSTTNLFQIQRTSPVRSRERMLVNSLQGVLVGDSMAPTNSTQRALRSAGMPQPSLISFSVTTPPLTVPAGVAIGYAAVLTREYSDGYIIKSVPSPIYRFTNTTGSGVAPTMIWEWGTTAQNEVQASDILEVYRTDGLVTTDVNADPGSTLKLIYRITLSATDISNTFFSLQDKTTLTAPFYVTQGKELYTNPYQEGSLGANRQPEINGAQAVFKGFTFFGNITERPQIVINVPAGIWDSVSMTADANARLNGVGGRNGAGTITSGSNTITAVSAADIVGVKIGQAWTGVTSVWPLDTLVTAVGASTITMQTNALSNAAVWNLSDVLNINGVVPGVRITSYHDFLENLGSSAAGVAKFELTSNISVPLNSAASAIGATLVIEPIRPDLSATLTAIATNGASFSPALVTTQTYNQRRTPNLLRWSKDSEPEHAPDTNETRVGSATLIQLVSTKDALWIFCTDGIFRLSGDAGVWRIDVVAPGCVLCSPASAVSMRDQVYAYTNYGFVAVTDSGVVPISDLVLKANLPGPVFTEQSTQSFLAANDNDEEVIIGVGSGASFFYIYNARFNSFTLINNAGTGLDRVTAGAYQQRPSSFGDGLVLLGNAPSGGQPSYAQWGGPGATFLAPVVRYRQFYAKDVMATKQWMDMTFFFTPLDAGKVITGTATGTTQGSATLITSFNDAYATIGITRQYAIAPSIQPGFTLPAAATQMQFRGVSLRYANLTKQQVRR